MKDLSILKLVRKNVGEERVAGDMTMLLETGALYEGEQDPEGKTEEKNSKPSSTMN